MIKRCEEVHVVAVTVSSYGKDLGSLLICRHYLGNRYTILQLPRTIRDLDLVMVISHQAVVMRVEAMQHFDVSDRRPDRLKDKGKRCGYHLITESAVVPLCKGDTDLIAVFPKDGRDLLQRYIILYADGTIPCSVTRKTLPGKIGPDIPRLDADGSS